MNPDPVYDKVITTSATSNGIPWRPRFPIESIFVRAYMRVPNTRYLWCDKWRKIYAEMKRRKRAEKKVAQVFSAMNPIQRN